MVTISQIRTKISFWASIRGKILLAFFVIVVATFGVAATNLTGLISEYLFDQRAREDGLLTERIASLVIPAYESSNAEEVIRLLEENADSMGGRLMVLDLDGKVQYDTFDRLPGQRLKLAEVLEILTGGAKEAYGMYAPGRPVVEDMSGEKDADYVAYSTREMIGAQGNRLGVMLFVSRVQRVVDSLAEFRLQLVSVFGVILLAALILALVLSQVLTKPITDLSRTMRKMGQGDLSVRATVRGSGELRELAENYNIMAAQLESLDKTRNQFVSNASHELKTPLATMKVMLESLIYQPEMPQELRQEFMQDLNHEIDRLTGIITDLLTLTRLDSGEGKAKRDEVDMSALTRDSVRPLQTIAEKRKQTLETRIQPNIRILGDSIKLNQILYNLADNAIKYTPDGGHILVVLEQQGGDVVWRVRDNGVGIPPEDLDHIFDRFYRVDKARSRETGGTGLGLSIVRQLVKLEGGSISVQSTLGQGSEFTVVFPQGGDVG